MTVNLKAAKETYEREDDYNLVMGGNTLRVSKYTFGFDGREVQFHILSSKVIVVLSH